MNEATLKIISDDMADLGLNYAFIEYVLGEDEEEPETYFTGEYQEREDLNEDGEQETEFILTGFSKTAYGLEQAKRLIKEEYPSVDGKNAIAEDGSAVAIFYANSLVIQSGVAGLKKMQINLIVKEWSVK